MISSSNSERNRTEPSFSWSWIRVGLASRGKARMKEERREGAVEEPFSDYSCSCLVWWLISCLCYSFFYGFLEYWWNFGAFLQFGSSASRLSLRRRSLLICYDSSHMSMWDVIRRKSHTDRTTPYQAFLRRELRSGKRFKIALTSFFLSYSLRACRHAWFSVLCPCF